MADALHHDYRSVRLPQSRNRIRTSLGFIAFHLASILLMLGVMASAPDPSGQVALVYYPGVSAQQAFLRAAASGGRPVRIGRFEWIVVVAPERDDPGFSARARHSGVIAILSPLIAGGCSAAFDPFNRQRPS